MSSLRTGLNSSGGGDAHWTAPVQGYPYEGNYNIAGIDGLTPDSGDVVVATQAGTPAAGVSDLLAIGDVAEYNGTAWKKTVSNVAGKVPAGTRLLISSTTVDGVILVAADYGKIATFNGASNTPIKTSPNDGDAAIVITENSVNENVGFVFDGVVPTGSWAIFTGGVDEYLSRDDQNLSALVTALDEDPALAAGITNTPTADGLIKVFVNGVEMSLGDGVKTKSCYFADPATPGTAKLIKDVVAGDKLRWMGSIAGFQLDASDLISLVYVV